MSTENKIFVCVSRPTVHAPTLILVFWSKIALLKALCGKGYCRVAKCTCAAKHMAFCNQQVRNLKVLRCCINNERDNDVVKLQRFQNFCGTRITRNMTKVNLTNIRCRTANIFVFMWIRMFEFNERSSEKDGQVEMPFLSAVLGYRTGEHECGQV